MLYESIEEEESHMLNATTEKVSEMN